MVQGWSLVWQFWSIQWRLQEGNRNASYSTNRSKCLSYRDLPCNGWRLRQVLIQLRSGTMGRLHQVVQYHRWRKGPYAWFPASWTFVFRIGAYSSELRESLRGVWKWAHSRLGWMSHIDPSHWAVPRMLQTYLERSSSSHRSRPSQNAGTPKRRRCYIHTSRAPWRTIGPGSSASWCNGRRNYPWLHRDRG